MLQRMCACLGDITQIPVDVIVNAANPSLMGGGGVDGAIHQAAGPTLLAECKLVRQQQGECPPGHAVITGAGNLPAKAVIHTVGPVWHGGEQHEADLLAEAYHHSLELATANDYHSISFPAISTGVYGYPSAEAARIAVATVNRYVTRRGHPERVLFVCFDASTLALYQQCLADLAAHKSL
ncbi:O-acetyl-ADP-ribose deacetylase [Shimwellia pseudoproteus]|uniref:O-acetyl-ADP-ribose deacetylase n=1 Tax=Shimwellia pseudoproteus TaxID=570012 RepID=UPI0018ED70D5|nr:O-acetyl-ADP-ribose deacetylase [Shimwellia pseudoproteus]MBJ3815969.1 O-acetyl-ADP-ribose deacetylase [Shimwellia pseudoproteus]